MQVQGIPPLEDFKENPGLSWYGTFTGNWKQLQPGCGAQPYHGIHNRHGTTAELRYGKQYAGTFYYPALPIPGDKSESYIMKEGNPWSGTQYPNGKPGKKLIYKDGKLLTGIFEDDGFDYKDGILHTGKIIISGDTREYKNGNPHNGKFPDPFEKDFDISLSYYPNSSYHTWKDGLPYCGHFYINGHSQYWHQGKKYSGIFTTENGAKYKMVKGAIYDGIVDDVEYRGSKIYNGTVDDVEYKDGKIIKGILNKIEYKDGKIFNAKNDSLEIRNGLMWNGIFTFDSCKSIEFKNGSGVFISDNESKLTLQDGLPWSGKFDIKGQKAEWICGKLTNTKHLDMEKLNLFDIFISNKISYEKFEVQIKNQKCTPEFLQTNAEQLHKYIQNQLQAKAIAALPYQMQYQLQHQLQAKVIAALPAPPAAARPAPAPAKPDVALSKRTLDIRDNTEQAIKVIKDESESKKQKT